MGFNTIFW